MVNQPEKVTEIPLKKDPRDGVRETERNSALGLEGFTVHNGWIKIHRKILDNPLSHKPYWAWLWVVLLLLANHEKNESFIWNNKITTIKKGQFITGRKRLNELTGIPESTIEDILKYLESQHQIQQQKTTKYRLITIVKWNEYQISDSKSDNRATTEQQQSDTNKNDKNYKNEKNILAEQSSAIVRVIDSFKVVNPSYGKWFGNNTQRGAIERMLKVHGEEKLLKVIALLSKSNNTQFCPVVTTPLQLEDKWAQLASALQKIKNKQPIIL